MADALPLTPPVNPDAAQLSRATTFGYWECSEAIRVLGVERARAAANWCAARAVRLDAFVWFFESLTRMGGDRG